MAATARRLTQATRAVAWVLARAAVPAATFASLATAIASRHGVPFELDIALHAWSVDHRSLSTVSIARLITASAGGVRPYVAVLFSGWAACGPATALKRKVLTAAVAVLALASGGWVRGVVTAALARPRPPLVDWAATASGYAFPSGHSTTSALAAGFLFWATRRAHSPRVARVVGTCGMGWATAVGASRVYLGMHWSTDVLGGWLFAAVWLTLALPPIAALTTDASP